MVVDVDDNGARLNQPPGTSAGPLTLGLRCRLMDGSNSVEVRAVRYAFVDRHGTAHYPIEFVDRIARAFAAAEPEAVIRHIEREEDELKAKGYLPGESFSHLWLEKRQPAFSLAWSWPDSRTR